MRRFALGFVCGATVVTVAFVLAWPEVRVADVDASARHTGPTEPTPDTAAGRTRVRPGDAGRDATSGAAEPGARSPAATTTGEGAIGADPIDPLADVRALVRAGDWDAVRRAVFALRESGKCPPVPRDLLLETAAAAPDAENPWALRVAAVEMGHSLPDDLLIGLLREIAVAPPGASPLDPIVGAFSTVLAMRKHSEGALGLPLWESGERERQLAGLHVAATARPPALGLLDRGARESADSDVRAAAIEHLVNRARAHEDVDARRRVGALAVAAHTGGASIEERDRSVLGLPYGGDAGLVLAERLVLRGGIDRDRTLALLEDMVSAGRLPRLLEAFAGRPALLNRLAQAVFESSEPSLADAMSLWHLVPQLIDAPGDEWTTSIAWTLVDVGRQDLVEAIVLNPAISLRMRADAVETLCDSSDADTARVVTFIDGLLADAATPVELRQEAVDGMWSLANANERAHVSSLRTLLRRVAKDDANLWVRANAAEMVDSLPKGPDE